MDSKRKASNAITLLLSINLIFYSLTAHATNPNTRPPHKRHTPPSNNLNPNPNTPPSNNPNPNPNTPSSNNPNTCPVDTLKLGVCLNLLRSLIGLVVGNPPTQPCCSLIQGLLDLEAAVCLCTTIKASLLGINLNIPLALSLLLNACGKNSPSGFTCN